jgi:hypothetical protein
MVREHERPLVQGGPPLGSAPGYGDVTEDVVGEQGTESSCRDKPKTRQIANTPLYKEELLPEEVGTSLDEGGAG